MKRYNPVDIEPKWQKAWAESNVYQAIDFDDKKPKFVMLTEFPYPSGDGLHLGHVREYTLGDIIARYKRMRGHNVLYPMGYDAFGLPTENYAIKHGIAPQKATEQNVGNFQKQFEAMGYSIDWSRSFRTSDTDYYKWTQWLFLQFYKHGLAYQADIAINWCPHCKTGLANEEVASGRHERCDTLVEKKQLKQWMLKITQYADRLIDGLQDVDFPSRIADQQINWIGRSKGAEITFQIDGHDSKSLTVFTTRPDTLYGATFMVVAPEHPLVDTIVTPEHKAAVNTYIVAAQAKSEIERQDTSREKTGVFTGAYAINPVNDQPIPIWVADYVLSGYGTGAIMAVPAHDQRDGEFAVKFGLPIIEVVVPETGTPQPNPEFRRSIVAIVRNPKTGEFLSIDWGKLGGQLFVGGGRDEGEDVVETARREIAEETGYTDLKLVAQTGPIMHNYFAHSKNVARRIEAYGLLFELASDTQQDAAVEPDEAGKFTVRWITQAETESKVRDELHATVYRQLVNGECYHGEGLMINSGPYDGKPSAEVREVIVADLTDNGVAQERINYKLRDWIFSRQHYWGEPIPIIHCDEHGAVAVPDDQLPVTLPIVEKYEPTDTGESPLAAIDEWVNTTCPTCGKPAKRETDTMPNWAGSSWYYLRYYDAHNDTQFADPEKLHYWGAVDVYLGGMEHTTLHLLYSRFWHQFLFDQGLVPTPEPYSARRGQGIVLAADGTKMSKSKGNVINPIEVVDEGYGADALRLAIAFLAPYDQTTPWSPEGVAGTYRFVQRTWNVVQEFVAAEPKAADDSTQELLRASHRTIKRVTDDLEKWSFNTAVSSMMELVNTLYKLREAQGYAGADEWRFALEALVKLLAPYAPHVADELWRDLGYEGSVHVAAWPKYDQAYLTSNTMTIVVQVNGKVRANVSLPTSATEDEVVAAAQSHDKVRGFAEGKSIKKTIYIPGRLVNIVAD